MKILNNLIFCNKYSIDKVSLKAQIERTVVAPGRNQQGAASGVQIFAGAPTEYQPAGRKTDKAEETAAAHQRLLLTWMVNDPKLFERLDGTISEEDFTDEDIKSVAAKLFEQYREKKSVSPAAIIDQYDDMEKQQKVAAMISTSSIRVTAVSIDFRVTRSSSSLWSMSR